jgi:hypothetical protein
VDEQPVFADPWWDLRHGDTPEQQHGEALYAELLGEVAAGHPVHGEPVEIIARSDASDDIVVELASGGWAVVHITWKGAAEPLPWPTVILHDTVESLERHIHPSDRTSEVDEHTSARMWALTCANVGSLVWGRVTTRPR